MIILNLNNQQFFNEGSNGLNINEFDICSSIEEFNFNEFLRSDYFKIDFLINIIKKEPNQDYLTPLFYPDLISLKDFKYFKGKKIFKYLERFANIDEWGSDYFDFQKLFKQFVNTSDSKLNGSYLLDKDWFGEKDERVKDKEYMLYDYYLLIFWIDIYEEKLYTFEWFAE